MKRSLQIIFPILGIFILVWVWFISVEHNGGIYQTFHGGNIEVSYNIFRLAALTAFVFMSYQVITGPYMHFWNKLYGKDSFYFFHAYEGIFVLLFALLHFIFIHIYMYFAGLNISTFDDTYLKPYIYFGPIVLVLLSITSATAILAVLILKQKQKRWWHNIHFANYIVYTLAFFHSLFLGTDLHPGSPLRPLWYIFFILFLGGFIYKRIIRQLQKA